MNALYISEKLVKMFCNREKAFYMGTNYLCSEVESKRDLELSDIFYVMKSILSSSRGTYNKYQ